MKKIILFSLMLFTIFYMQAGSLELYFDGNAIPPGASVQVIGDPGDEYIQARINVKNTSSLALDVKAKKIIHQGDTLAGSANYFCWDLCYPPFTYESLGSVKIEAGETNEDFYGDYNPHTVIGISRVTYVFFDRTNTTDSVAVVVEFNASPASVTDLSEGVKFSEAYPNPATSVVNIDYSLNSNISSASVVISNMLGCRVKEITLKEEAGRVQLPVSELGNGIYFYSLIGNKQVILTRKFVLQR